MKTILPTQHNANTTAYQDALIQGVTALNTDITNLSELLTEYSMDPQNVNKEPLILALENIHHHWISNLLPSLEAILTNETFLRGGLEHAFAFQYGMSAQEQIDDPETIGRISGIVYLWRIVGPLLLELVSHNTVTLSREMFCSQSSTFVLGSSRTPENIRDILNGAK